MSALVLSLLLSASPAGSHAKPRKVIRLDALTVEGRIQKPQAFYILPRQSLSFEQLQRPQSFVKKIAPLTKQEPF